MNILELRDYRHIDDKIKKLTKQLQILNYPVELNGSASLQSQKYFSDYDFFSDISTFTEPQKLYNEMLNIIKNIITDINTYFIEFKIQYKNGDKIKWFSIDDFDFNTFYNDFDEIEFLKLDLITIIDYKFFEVSCIYSLSKKPFTKNDALKKLKKDIIDLKKEGKFYKILKRKFTIYKLNKNYDKLILLTNIFNSDIGHKYQILSNVEAIKKLLEITNDKTVIKKAVISLKDLHVDPSIKNINSTINKLNKEINEYAKNIKL